MEENLRITLRRSSWVLLAVGLLSSVGVYFGHGWFHDRFLPAWGIGAAIGDALGGFAIILVAFAGQRLASLALFRDVSFGLLHTTRNLHRQNQEIQRELNELDRLANVDKLTGCWNRHRLEEAIRSEMDRLTRYDQALSMLVIDIDHFKQVNDRYGHHVGDQILAEFSEKLRFSLRTSDSLTRWGGEEFVVLCPNTSLPTAIVLAERLREKVTESTFESVDALTISVGVAECQAEESWQQWFERADAALYRAKESGRNRVHYAPGSREYASVLAQSTNSFVKLAWHPVYASGNDTIDREHQILFGLANDLLNSIISAKPTEETRAIIGILLREIVLHFDNEEAILLAAGYPGLADHAAAHHELVDKAVRLSNQFQSNPQDIGELFQYLVHEVVAKHMLGADREYFPYLPPAPVAAG